MNGLRLRMPYGSKVSIEVSGELSSVKVQWYGVYVVYESMGWEFKHQIFAMPTTPPEVVGIVYLIASEFPVFSQWWEFCENLKRENWEGSATLAFGNRVKMEYTASTLLEEAARFMAEEAAIWEFDLADMQWLSEATVFFQEVPCDQP